MIDHLACNGLGEPNI